MELWDFYGKAAARAGYQAGPENFGYLQPVMIADNQERAEELGQRLLFGGAFAHFARPEWMFPPGYNSKAATRRLARLDTWPQDVDRSSPVGRNRKSRSKRSSAISTRVILTCLTTCR